MDVSDSIVDLLSQLPLIKLNLKTNSSLLVRVHHLAEENCRLVTNVHTAFMELIFKKCSVSTKTSKNQTQNGMHTP